MEGRPDAVLPAVSPFTLSPIYRGTIIAYAHKQVGSIRHEADRLPKEEFP